MEKQLIDKEVISNELAEEIKKLVLEGSKWNTGRYILEYRKNYNWKRAIWENKGRIWKSNIIKCFKKINKRYW